MRVRSPIRTGFTIIDAVGLVVVLAVAVPGMAWGLAGAARQRSDTVMTNRARWLAVERLEQVIADRANPARGYTFLVPANYPAETSIAGFPGFARSVAFVETGPTLTGAGTGYRRATVTVTWSGGRSLALSSVLVDHP
jgi:hypothetical protein